MKYQKARFHDYCAPGCYHFTLTQLPGRLPFSHVSGTPAIPEVHLTPFGELTQKLLRETISSLRSVLYGPVEIMPDHIHVLITVQERLSRSIRSELAVFKSRCSQAYAALCGTPVKSVFVTDVHDRIIFDRIQLENCRDYIRDNPRRLLVKRLHPELFRVYNHIRIGDREMAAYGNVFLLRDFHRQQVCIHRAWTKEELESHRQGCLRCAENGGVLVSPFIHPREREIREEAIERGARVIHLKADGFEGRFKPQGTDFGLCSEGKLLLLAPWPENSNGMVTRHEALSLNRMASEITRLTPDTPLTLKSNC